MAIEIVDLPINSMVDLSIDSYVNAYQRVFGIDPPKQLAVDGFTSQAGF